MTRLRNIAGRLHNGREPLPDTPEAGSDADEPATERAGVAPSENEGRSTAEKVTTAISVLLIVALAGAILYEGYATGEADPARLEVTILLEQIEQRGDDYYIPVEILNDGDQTVEEVAVGIELLDGEEVVDEAETVIATLGEAEMVIAVLVVADDPTGLTIEAGVVTYQIAED
ncbi:MAG TPA: hypothetical protein VEX37_00100 [Thermomicrobiales bacterium]|nr:hypothetical protein [Thermomicrobiales bacterium]